MSQLYVEYIVLSRHGNTFHVHVEVERQQKTPTRSLLRQADRNVPRAHHPPGLGPKGPGHANPIRKNRARAEADPYLEKDLCLEKAYHDTKA